MSFSNELERYVTDIENAVAYKGIGKKQRKYTGIMFHARRMAELIVGAEARKAVELGTCTGEGLCLLGAACSVEGNVTSIDIKRKNDIYKNEILKRYPPLANVRCLTGDSVDNTIISKVMADDQLIDVLFIDSSHLRNRVLKEINAWFPFLSNDAIVFFHDAVLCHDTVRVSVDDVLDGLSVLRWCSDLNFEKLRLYDVPDHAVAGIDDSGRPFSQAEIDDRREGAEDVRFNSDEFFTTDASFNDENFDVKYELIAHWPGLIVLSNISESARESIIEKTRRILDKEA